MARTALDVARGWRTVLRTHRLVDTDLAFSAVDATVLSLVLDLVRADTVACADETLGGLLDDLWSLETGSLRRVVSAPDGVRTVVLTQVVDLRPEPDGAVITLVYGLRRGLPFVDCGPELHGLSLWLLSSVAPALWQCGLGLVTPEAETPPALLGDLGAAMRGEWIDPLLLYERVQVMTAKLKGLGHAEAADADAKQDRIAELELELASLKRAALVNQHLLLVDAAERSRSGS